MVDSAPLQRSIGTTVPAVSASTPQDQAIDAVPFAGTVSGVSFVPEADITGQASNYRTYRVVNTGQDGNGTTVVASLAFSSSGVTANDFDEKAITLSATAADLVVAAGDVLKWDEAVTGSGLATPGGRVKVLIDRS